MNVWIVEFVVPYEGSRVVGVYSSPEQAEAVRAAATLGVLDRLNDASYVITEWPVDSAPDL